MCKHVLPLRFIRDQWVFLITSQDSLRVQLLQLGVVVSDPWTVQSASNRSAILGILFQKP